MLVYIYYTQYTYSYSTENKKMHWPDILFISFLFWFICLVSLIFISIFLPFFFNIY